MIQVSNAQNQKYKVTTLPLAKHTEVEAKTNHVFQKILQSTPARFLNQEPSNFFVSKGAGAVTYLTVVFLAGILAPYGLVGAILLVPVIKQVAYRTGVIAGNTFSHMVCTTKDIILCSQEDLEEKSISQRFMERMKGSRESEIDPFTVSVLGSMAGEAVWALFVSILCPVELVGIAKVAVKAVVTVPYKQLGKAASQYGYNTLLGTNRKSSVCLSVKSAFTNLTSECGATATVDSGCMFFSCGSVAKFFLYIAGMDLGTRAGKAMWEFGHLVIFNRESLKLKNKFTVIHANGDG